MEHSARNCELLEPIVALKSCTKRCVIVASGEVVGLAEGEFVGGAEGVEDGTVDGKGEGIDVEGEGEGWEVVGFVVG